jgi:hypothetical protein
LFLFGCVARCPFPSFTHRFSFAGKDAHASASAAAKADINPKFRPTTLSSANDSTTTQAPLPQTPTTQEPATTAASIATNATIANISAMGDIMPIANLTGATLNLTDPEINWTESLNSTVISPWADAAEQEEASTLSPSLNVTEDIMDLNATTVTSAPNVTEDWNDVTQEYVTMSPNNSSEEALNSTYGRQHSIKCLVKDTLLYILP